MAPFVIRPVQESDFPGLAELAEAGEGGLTTLPNNPDFLRNRIVDSLHSFDPKIRRPGDHSHLFILEDLARKGVVGCCGILSKVGGFDPFYTYRIENEVHRYPPLGFERTFEVLHLQANHNGPSEVCSLFLNPDYRKAGLGRLLSLSRFHFMAEFPERFEREVIAEMRGKLNDKEESPFWEAVGRQFFQQDFHSANILSGLGNKEFIASLMPRYPLYIDLLPPEAREVIGLVHQRTKPALKLLQNEGFCLCGEVDIFDAGPLVKCRLDSIRTVRERAKVRLARLEGTPPEQPRCLLSNASLDFRACLGEVRPVGDGTVALDAETAALLKVQTGEFLAFSPLFQPQPEGSLDETKLNGPDPSDRKSMAPR